MRAFNFGGTGTLLYTHVESRVHTAAPPPHRMHPRHQQHRRHLTVASVVLDQPSASAAVLASVVVEVLTPEAPRTVRSHLVGPEFADLARRWGVVVGGAFAALAM